MRSVAPGITDVIDAILTLGRTKTAEGIPRSRIHAILWAMQPEEPLLSRVRFSITGDVCLSRDIDTAIDKLISKGTLRLAKDSTILLNDVPTLRSLHRARQTRPHFHELLNASRNFHKRLDEWKTAPSSEMPGKEMNA